MHEDVEVDIGPVVLRGRLYRPEDAHGPVPVVVAHSGIGTVAEGNFHQASSFTEAGLAVLHYDHRGFGYSDGFPRQQVDPWQFARDLRDVLTHLGNRPDVDALRIALWGKSLGGLVSLFTAATDPRVAAVTAIVPPVSGISARRLFPAGALRELDAQIAADRRATSRGGAAVLLRTSGERRPGEPPVVFDDPQGNEYVAKVEPEQGPTFRNEITLSSLDRIFEMEAIAYAERITAPVLMVLADHDTVAPVEDARAMFARITAPKELVEYPGQHYGILLEHEDEIVTRSVRWLADRLG